jgi:hypothetical protein
LAQLKEVYTICASPTGGKETILLVEDDGHLRTAARITLARLGYRLLETVIGVEALRIWQQQRGEIPFSSPTSSCRAA